MADQIREEIRIDGNAEGGVQALRTTSKEMGAVEQKAASVANKIQGFGSRVSGFFGKIGQVAATVGKAAMWTGIISGAVLATLGIVNLTRNVLRLAAASDQVREFDRNMNKVKATLASPFVHFAAQAFAILNGAMKDPAVQHLIRQFALLATVILRSVLPAVSALAGAITAFAHAFAEGDWANIFQRTWSGFVEGWKSAGEAAGAGAGATFSEAWQEEAAKAAGSGAGALRGGFLKNIGDLGTSLLNSLLSGFKSPDLSVLNQAADAIRARLDTLFKQGKISEISIVPRVVFAQTAVAEALREASAAGGVNDEIIARLREKLQSLGPDVQEYVVQLLRARDATIAIEQATDDLAKKQANLATAQRDLADAQARHAAEEAKLLPLADEIRDLQQELAQLLIDQTADRERLVALAEEEEDAQRELARLTADQEQRLAGLASLRKEIADAAEAQYQAELKVREAQEALIPLQEKLKAAQAAASKLQEQITENQRLRTEAIEEAQRALNQEVGKLEDALAHVGDKYQSQLDTQQEIIDATDARWRSEIEGATQAYNLTKKRFDLEDTRNKKALLGFAQQRAEANLIGDPTKRIAALARINRAEEQFGARNKDRLDAARLENELAESALKTKEADRDAEKAGALEEITRLQALIEGDRTLLQERLTSVREEGQARIAAMREAADEAARREAADLRAAQAVIAAAQADVDRQQGAIDLLEREARQIREKKEAAEHDLAAREKLIHDETDGAIAVAKTRADSATAEREKLDDRLSDETRTLTSNIAAKQADLDLQKSKVDEIAEKEVRPLEARLAVAQTEADAAQLVLDNSQTALENITKAADISKGRVDAEERVAELLDQQRQLLQAIQEQQAKSGPAGGGGPGFGGADLAKQLAKPFSEAEIAAFQEKLDALFAKLKEKWQSFDWGSMWQTLVDKGVQFFTDNPQALAALGILIGKGLGGSGALGYFLGNMFLEDPEKALIAVGSSPFTLIGSAIGLRLGGPAGAAFLGGFGKALDDTWKTWVVDWAKGQTAKNVADTIVISMDLPGSLEARMREMAEKAEDKKIQDRITSALANPYTAWWDLLFGHSVFPEAQQSISDFLKDLPGTITSLAGSILSSLTRPFSDAATQIGHKGLGFIGTIWTGVTTGFTAVKTDTTPLVQTFTTGVSDLVKGARDLVVGATGGAGYFGDIKSGVHTSLTGIRDDAVGPTQQGGIVGSLVTGITGLFASAKSLVTDPATGTLAVMTKDAKTRADELHTALLGTGAPIPTTQEGMISAFQAASTTITDANKGPLANLGTGLVTILGSVAKLLYGDDGTGGAIGVLGLGIRGAFDLIFGPAEHVNTILWLLTHGGSGSNVGGNAEGGFFPRLEHATVSALNWERIKVWQAGFEAIFGVIKAFLDPKGKEGKALLTWVDLMGQAIGQALADGLLKKLTAVYNAAVDLIKEAKRGMDDESKKGSPPKEFTDRGESYGLALAGGMGKTLEKIALMAALMVDVAARAIDVRSSLLGGISVPETGIDFGSLLAQSAGAGVPGGNKNFFAGIVHVHDGPAHNGYKAQEWQDAFT